MSKAKQARTKKINGYKMPERLPVGEILHDVHKNGWVLGPSIGKGGFGEIYSAKKADNTFSDYKYVIKIEPHDNGPLFVEMHFYTRCAREAAVSMFQKSKNLKHLGMPVYIASGSHTYNFEKYRFILMERFAPKDVWKLFIENDKKLPPVTVYLLGIQMLDVLEYIHSKGYIHGDVKGANILLSLQNRNNAFLVDFGLAAKFTTEPLYLPDPKRMHNGTIEYASRDAHHGVQTRRGDIEILAFNLIHWLAGVLPWEGTSDLKIAQQSKEKHMNDIDAFLSTCFSEKPPSSIKELLSYINIVKHNQAPDYDKIKKILLRGLHAAGGTENSPLEFSSAKRKSSSLENGDTPKKRTKATSKTLLPRKNKNRGTNENELVIDIADDEAPTASMNAEEKRILALKAKTANRGKKKAVPTITEDDTDSEDLRLTTLKARTPVKPRKQTTSAVEDTENVSPPSSSATKPAGVRSSPRLRAKAGLASNRK